MIKNKKTYLSFPTLLQCEVQYFLQNKEVPLVKLPQTGAKLASFYLGDLRHSCLKKEHGLSMVKGGVIPKNHYIYGILAQEKN